MDIKKVVDSAIKENKCMVVESAPGLGRESLVFQSFKDNNVNFLGINDETQQSISRDKDRFLSLESKIKSHIEENNAKYLFVSLKDKEVLKYCEIAENIKVPLVLSITRTSAGSTVTAKAFDSVQDMKNDLPNILGNGIKDVKINSFLNRLDNVSNDIIINTSFSKLGNKNK